MNTLSLHLPIFSERSSALSIGVNPKIILSIVILLFLFLLGFYLFQMGELTENSYLLTLYQKELKGLEEQNLAFQEKAVKVASLQQIEEKIKTLGFVEVSEVKYIPLPSDYLITKNH